MRSYDVIVVGGGIVGGAIALQLAQSKLRVAILDRQDPGREASWAAAGMLSPAPDSPSAIPLVPLGRASLNLYPQFVSEIEEISGLARRTAPRRRDRSALFRGCGTPTEHAGRLAPRPGIAHRAAAHRRSAKARAGVGPRSARGGLDGATRARWIPAALTEAVLAAAAASGVELHANTNVTRIACRGRPMQRRDHRRRKIWRWTRGAGGGSVFIANRRPRAALPVRPIRGQMVALSNGNVPLRHVLRSERGYLVPREEASPQRIVAGSTLEDAGFEKRVTPGGLEQIFSAAQELAPTLGGAEVLETWCGLRPDTPDHLPLLGPGELAGLTIATGHYRNGILLAPITAKLVREWITEQRVSMDWQLFDPHAI